MTSRNRKTGKMEKNMKYLDLGMRLVLGCRGLCTKNRV